MNQESIPTRPNPSRLAVPKTKGGTQEELRYADWHSKYGQPLKRKYRAPK